MKLFNKPAKDAVASGRRRPVDSNQLNRQSTAFSYHTQRSASSENIGRGTEHITPREDNSSPKSRLTRHRLAAVLLVIVILPVGLYLSLITAEPRIVPHANGSDAYFLQDSSVYARTVQNVLKTSILHTNKLTVDTTAISAALLSEHAEIAAVKVHKPIFASNLSIHIEPQRPALILTTTDSSAFLLDTTGRALISTSQLSDSGELSVPTVHDASGLSIKPGVQALPRNAVTFIQTVTNSLESKDITFGNLTLPRTASQLDVALAGKQYIVKFNLEEDARQQAGTYLAAQKRLDKEKILPTEYIDVRVPERAYYK